MMPVRLLYDVSVIGAAMTYETSKTGVYRVVIELLQELEKREDVKIQLSQTALPQFLNTTRKFLKKENYPYSLSNELKYPLPHHILGRGKRVLKKVYNVLGIDNDSIIYDEEIYANADIFHSPFYKIPDELKEYKHLSRCITIHDLIPILYSDIHHKQKEMEETLASIGNDHVICVSENTKNDLLNYDTGLKPDKVFVSHPAADQNTFYPCNNRDKFKLVKQKYGIPDNYFLSLCTLEPRKNLARLVRCFYNFIREYKINDLSLVLVGSKGWQFDDIFYEINQTEKLRNKIIVTGHVPDSELATIYSNAHSFYYLSLYEGFGLPPLEAMQCGVATVTSNRSSLPEVAGDAAVLVDPADEDQICDVMFKLYNNSDVKTLYQQKGRERAMEFSWAKTAQEHGNIYRTILENDTW
jgi:glycosyltransferase involved in cell wall biosynthesis